MATAGLTMHFDWKPFIAATNALKRPALDRAVALALVDTAKSANAKAATAIAKHTALKSARVKQGLSYDRVSVGQYHVNLRASRKLVPLIDFRARQTGGGVRASKPWGKTQVFRATFIATMRSGHRGVYRRVGKKRLPIVEMMGSSIHGSFQQANPAKAIVKTVKERLPKALARRVRQQRR